jgi:rhodanese-related sulfurtransferase
MKRFLLITLLAATVPVLQRAADSPTPAPKDHEHAVPQPFKNVDVPEFEKLRGDKKNVVLDVRTPKEFAAGHMPGAINIDVNAPDFEKRVKELDPKRTYLVHCAAGVRSAKACDKLGKMDFSSLYNLQGGFKAWEKAGHQPEH